jgi:hypothetical protein
MDHDGVLAEDPGDPHRGDGGLTSTIRRQRSRRAVRKARKRVMERLRLAREPDT